MKEKDIPNIPCDYHGNDWHEQLFTGNTVGVGFLIEILSTSSYSLRTRVQGIKQYKSHRGLCSGKQVVH